MGRYILLEKIGSGGMAEVWKARVDGPAGFVKTVAVKRMLAELSEKSEYVDLFTKEALLAASLHHPNIVQVFDFGHAGTHEGDDFGYFMAMEFVDGENLAALLHASRAAGESLPLELCLYIALSVARGLAHAHGSGQSTGHDAMVHQDISPHNILLARTGEVKITDFGIARLAAEIPEHRRLMGKLAYLSPEQVRSKLIDHRTDLFALGVVLVEMLTGKRLFATGGGADKAAILQAIRSFRPESHPLIDACPADVRPVVLRLLAPSPERRYESALQAERALGRLLGMEGAIAARQTLAHLMNVHFRHHTELVEETDERTLTKIVRDAKTAAPALRFDTASETKMTASTTFVPTHRRRLWWVALTLGAVSILALVVGWPRLFGPGEATPRPTSTALARTSPETATPTPIPTEVTAATSDAVRPTHTSAPMGSLTVNARPWVQVWVDDERATRETPLRNYAIAPGPHVLRFENPARGFTLTHPVTIEPGQDVALFVDVDAGQVESR